jgi:tetratricopeptide (TPR) repeat protein
MEKTKATPSTLAAALLVGALVACGGDEVAERADTAAEAPAPDRLAELRAALRSRPDDARAHFAMAEELRARGEGVLAAYHYREAQRYEPGFAAAFAAEADLYAAEDPSHALALLERAIERAPEDAALRVRQAELALEKGDAELALEAARAAASLAPEDAKALSILGRAHALRPGGALEAVSVLARAADRTEPAARWRLLLEIARVRAGSAELAGEAEPAFRAAVEAAAQAGPAERVEAAEAALAHAAAARSPELRAFALEQIVAAEPGRIARWTELAGLREKSDGGGRAVLEELLALRPRDAEAHTVFARFLLERGEGDAALAHLERAVADGVDPPLLLGVRVDALYALGRRQEAERATEELAAAHPDHPSAEQALAQRDIVHGRFAEAASRLQRVIGGLETANAHYLLALATRLSGDLEEAAVAIARAFALSPEPPVALYVLRGHIRFESGQCRGALEDLAKGAAAQRLGPPEQLMVASCLYEAGQFETGRRVLEGLLAASEPYAPALDAYAEREGKRDPKRALAVLDQVRARGAAGARRELARARVLVRLGRLDEAQQAAERALGEEPRALHFLVSLYTAHGRLDAAIGSLAAREQRGQLAPDERVMLAGLYEQKGDDARARATYEGALQAGVVTTVVKNNLAYLLAKASNPTRAGDLERARALAEEAVRESGDAHATLDTLGYVQLRQDQAEAARSSFRRALRGAPEKGPEAPVYHYHLGLALQALGRSPQAARSFERALALDPKFPHASEARAALSQEGRAR